MLAIHAAENCPPSATGQFFPPGIFESTQYPDSAERSAEWASKILASMHEPSLSCGSLGESYRFTWIHSFTTRQPTAVRITRDDGRWHIVAVRLQDARDRNISERIDITLADEDARLAVAAFQQFGLWHKSSFAYDPDVYDGAMWIVEGRLGTGYHAVLRASVDEDALRELALTLFGLSRMNPGQIHRRAG